MTAARRPTALPLLAALLAAGLARAQEPPGAGPVDLQRLRLEARLGLVDPEELPGGWTALEVLLENGPRAGPVELEVVFTQDAGPDLTLRRSVDLSPAQRRREWFLLPVGSHGSVRVLARRPRTPEEADELGPGEVLAASETAFFDGPYPGYRYGYQRYGHGGRLLVVTDAPDDRRVATWLTEPGLAQAVRVPADLPESPLALDEVDLVVVHGADLDRLTARQEEALLLWVRSGGRVLLLPQRSAGWFASRVVSRLLGPAVEVVAREVADLRALDAYDTRPRTRGEEPLTLFEARGPTLLEQPRRQLDSGRPWPPPPGGAPLLSTLALDRGRVHVLAFDPLAPPFDRWIGTTPLLNDVVRVAGGWRDPLLGHQIGGDGGPYHVNDELIRHLNSRTPPSRTFVLLLVLAYIACVAPLNVWLLRRRDRTVLLVFTVPGIALAFSGLVFAVGYAAGGLSTVAWRTTVVLGDLGAAVARETTSVSVLSAMTSSYEVEIDGGDVAASPVFREPRHAKEETFDVDQTPGGWRFSGIRLGLWEQAYFQATGLRDLGEGLRVRRRADGGLQALNGTPFDLERGVVAVGQRLWRLPRLASGAEVTLERLPLEGGWELARSRQRHQRRHELARAGQPLPPDLALLVHGDDEAAAEHLRGALRGDGGHLLRSGRTLVLAVFAPSRRVAVDGDADPDRNLGLLLLWGEVGE